MVLQRLPGHWNPAKEMHCDRGPGRAVLQVRSGKRRLSCHLSCRCHHYRFRISKSLPEVWFVHGVIQFSNLAV